MSVLSETLVKEFVKATKDDTPKKEESFMYGTVTAIDGDTVMVQFDGADDIRTPCATTVSVADNDRVVVMLKNRQAVITSNVTNPTINTESLEAGTIKARDQYLIDIVRDGRARVANLASMDLDEDEDKLELTIGEHSMLMINIPTDLKLLWHMYVEGTAFIDGGIEIGPLGYRDIHIYPGSSLRAGAIYAPDFYGETHPSSDRRLKHDIEDADETNALGKINQIRHRKFVWNKDNKFESLGYVAQELGEIDPGAVDTDKDMCYINLLHLTALCTKSIQELSAKVDSLERRLEELESERNQELPD